MAQSWRIWRFSLAAAFKSAGRWLVVGMGATTLAMAGTDSAPASDTLAFPRIGRIRARAAREITASTWSVGCEVLDRDFASYAAYKRYLGPLGAKAIRVQAGWAKTEQVPGTYDWAWLDAVVDDARGQSTQPWLQLSYGNPAYAGGGGRNIGDAGPTTPEAVAAWDRWVTAAVRRYRDRVKEWEIWNEPDLSKKMQLADYVSLYIRTATIIRQEQPAARIYALSLANKSDYARKFLQGLQAEDKLGLVDAITFHSYPHNPDDLKTLQELRKVVVEFPRKIELRQGETGAPSGKTTGALGGYEWNDTKQAKWDLRRMLAHHGNGVPFNLFTLSEFFYPHGLNAKGLLRINRDLSVIGPKPAYFAAQNVFAIFDVEFVAQPERAFTADVGGKVSVYVFAQRRWQRSLVALWRSGEPPGEANHFVPIDLRLPRAKFVEPVCVDLRTGDVFRIPADKITLSPEGARLRGFPVYDSPLVIASRGDLPVAP